MAYEDVWGGAVDRLVARDAFANTLDDQNPSEARKARVLGRQLGEAPGVVAADLPGFEKEAQAKETRQLFDIVPELAVFAADPANANAIKDDLPTMADIGKMLGTRDAQGNPLGRRFVDRMKGSTTLPYPLTEPRARYGAVARAFEPVAPQRASEGQGDFFVNREIAGGIAAGTISTLIGKPTLEVLDIGAKLIGKEQEFMQSGYRARVAGELALLDREANLQFDPIGSIGGIEINPGQIAYSGTTSTVQMLGAIATRRPLTALSLGSGADQSQRIKARGGNSEEALLAGLGTGLIEAGTEKLPMEYLLGNFGKEATGKFIGNLLIREAPSEVIATVGQGAIDALTTGGKGWDQYVADLPQDIVDTVGATVVLGGQVGALQLAARRFSPQARDMDDAVQASVGAAFVDKLMAKAETSKVRTEDPETFREFVESQTRDTPVRDIYVPVEAIRELQQSEGYDPQALAPYEEQIAEAEATQGDVVIPIAEAAAYLAGTPAWEALKDKVRLQPGGLSQKEALERHDEIMRVLEQRGEEIAAEVEQNEAIKSDATEVYQDVRARLLSGGVESKLAEQTAKVVAARYEARAARRGGTAMEAWQQSGIKFDWETKAKGKGRKLEQQPLVIGDVVYEVNEDGTYTVELASKDDKRQLGDKLAIKDLRKQLGEELTARILSGEGGTEGRRVIANQDLTIGKDGLALRQPNIEQKVEINIGLDIPTGGKLSPAEAAQALEAMGVAIRRSEVRQSATELTLVAEIDKALTPEQAFKLSETLQQEAIAQRVGDTGALYGPQAEKWGDFNPEFFLSFDTPPEDAIVQAGWTPERVSGLINEYGYPDGSSKAFAVMMSPDQFLGLTASEKGRELIRQRVEGMTEYGALDVRQLAESGPIFLNVTLANEPSEVQKRMGVARLDDQVIGHEGRHRMMMLKLAGVQRVPVVVMIENRTEATRPRAVSELQLNPQRSRSDQVANGDQKATVEGVPISWKFKDQLDGMEGRILFQSEQQGVFYSGLARAIEQNQTKRATGAQWAATLRKTPGVKQEELEWTGLLEYLEATEGLIERERLIELVEQGGVQVEEVLLLQPTTVERDEEGNITDYTAPDGETQFQSWSSDPSNPTYRELLITLPVGVAGNPTRAPSTHWDTEGVVAHTRFMDKTDADGKRVLFVEEIQSDWHQKGRDEGYAVAKSAEEIEQLKQARQEAERDVTRADQAMRDFAPKVGIRATLHSADLRDMLLNVTANSEFYEEAKAVREAFDRAELRETEAVQAYQNARYGSGIPNAPFKSSWPALVMKRLIRYAAENGYDRIAWTTGEEQAERYDLSRQVGRVIVAKFGEGQYIVRLPEAGGAPDLLGGTLMTQSGISWRRVDADQIRAVFGNDLGGRMIERADATDLDVTLEGGDLRVGGEGMKAFYDRNLVNITNDIIKKYGAKVSIVKIKGEDPQRAGLVNLLAKKHGLATYGIASRAEAEARIEEWKRNIEQGTGDTAKAGQWIAELQDALPIIDRIERMDAEPGIPKPGFDITDKMREAAMAGFTLFQGQARGSTTFLSDGVKLIRLFETANESTLIHEFGHIWLEELRADAMADGATSQEKADWQSLVRWWDKLGVTIGDGEIPTAAHEYFARTFERYFREGRAPIRSLRGAFKAFSDWLKNIYRAVLQMDAPINPTLRGIFDRMLATEDAIDAYRAQERVGPLFNSAEEAGMTEAEFAAYNRLVENARDTAYDVLLEKTMAAIRRQRQSDLREQRGNVRSEVAAEINAQPMFRALHLLRTGRWLGDPDRPTQNVKLNTGWLIDTFGEEILDKLPRGLPITHGAGLDGDVVAEMVGAASGQDLVHQLVGLRVQSEALRAAGETRSLRDKMIDDQVDAIMAERHGDTLNDGSIEEEAIAALNTAAQGEIIGAEIRQLGKRASQKQPETPYQFAREWARRKVVAGKVVDTVSRAALQRYTRATAKAARLAEAAILEGNTDEAYRQKQAQLLNHALLAESKKAADEIDTIIARMKRLAGRAAMKSVDQDYLDKIHMLLENYDFRPRSQKSIDEQEGFQQWAERQRANGFEVHIPPRLENRGEPYSRVKVEELLSLNDLVESLLHIGRTKQKLRVAQQERDWNEFVDEVVANIEQLPQRKLPEKPINEEKRRLADSAAELLKIETLVEELDGGPTGPLHDVIVLGATNAENRRNELRHRVLVPIAQAYHALDRKAKKRLKEKVTLPELTWNTLNEGDPRAGQPVTITRSELLSIALNMGNLSNLEKLSKGERWPVPTLQAIMDRELTKEDWDFVQLLWRQVGSLWSDIVATEREMAGVVPEQVVPVPIETRFGTYEGGYWPVVYDAGRWQRAEDIEDKKLDDMFGIASGIATQKGHTITRTGAFGPINLSLENVLFQHIDQVVTRIAFTAYARDVMRVITNPRIRGIIDTRLGSEYRGRIKPWLARTIHEGAVNTKAARWWDGLLNQARINLTVAAMGFRFSTGVAQTLGLTASAQRIGALYVARGMKRIALNPRKAAEFAFDRSPELVNRTNAANREVREVFDKLRGEHSWLTEAQAWAFWHIGMIDRYAVSLPTWLGAHQRGLDEGMTDEEASAYADKSVRLSQGAGGEKDLSAIQSLTNSAALRFFTMFYSPFNVMFNAQWQGIRGLKKGQLAPMIGVTFWWMIVSTLGDAMLAGDWPEDDEEDDGALDEWMGWFGRNVFFGMFAGLPLARDLASGTERKIIGEYADPGATPVSRVYDAVEQTYRIGDKYMTEGELPDRPIRKAADLTAVLTGTPVSQAGTTGQFLWDYGQGETSPQSISDWYFGITRGKVPSEEESK